MAWFWVFLPAVIFFTTAIGIGIWHAKRNNADGVIANWRNLRITHTELIEGYLQNARRHSLKGLKARVEDSGTRHTKTTGSTSLSRGRRLRLSGPQRPVAPGLQTRRRDNSPPT
jgi:transcription initiation factor TFIID subunit TAF12